MNRCNKKSKTGPVGQPEKAKSKKPERREAKDAAVCEGVDWKGDNRGTIGAED